MEDLRCPYLPGSIPAGVPQRYTILAGASREAEEDDKSAKRRHEDELGLEDLHCKSFLFEASTTSVDGESLTGEELESAFTVEPQSIVVWIDSVDKSEAFVHAFCLIHVSECEWEI